MSDLTLYDHDEQGESGNKYELQQIVEPPMQISMSIEQHNRSILDAIAAGRSAALREAEKNIIALADDENPSAQDLISIGSALTAIRALMVKP